MRPVVRAALARRLRRVLEIGCLPTDSDQERVTKEVFVVIGLGAVYERLKTQFEFQRRGVIDVKGKGSTLTYLLVGRVEEVAEPPRDSSVRVPATAPSVGPRGSQVT